MNDFTPWPPHLGPQQSLGPLERRLAGLRGDAPQRSLDARALAALAANPGCSRRAVLDAAGVDKTVLANRLGHPAPFGQSPFAISRGLGFERRVKADGCAELLDLLRTQLHLPPPFGLPGDDTPVVFAGLVTDHKLPANRVASARAALLAAAARPGVWTVLDQPLLRLEVAGSIAHLEPDLVVVRPDGRWTVVEIKSFPILDDVADPAKVGAAARQAAVYVLALRETAAELAGVKADADPYHEPEGLAGAPDTMALLVCPKDFSNRPTGAAVDVRKPMAVTRRQLARLTRVEQLLDVLPPGTDFGQHRTELQLTAAVGAMEAVYSPDCLSACEMGFHCRAEARCAGSVETLGRGVRGELGSFRTIDEALHAAAGRGTGQDGRGPVRVAKAGADGGDRGADLGGSDGGGDDGDAESALRLARAAALRAEALAATGPSVPSVPAHTAGPAQKTGLSVPTAAAPGIRGTGPRSAAPESVG